MRVCGSCQLAGKPGAASVHLNMSAIAQQTKVMGKAPGIVYRTIATYLTRKAGYAKPTDLTCAVTLIQYFDVSGA